MVRDRKSIRFSFTPRWFPSMDGDKGLSVFESLPNYSKVKRLYLSFWSAYDQVKIYLLQALRLSDTDSGAFVNAFCLRTFNLLNEFSASSQKMLDDIGFQMYQAETLLDIFEAKVRLLVFRRQTSSFSVFRELFRIDQPVVIVSQPIAQEPACGDSNSDTLSYA